jgi:hypothetical protein
VTVNSQLTPTSAQEKGRRRARATTTEPTTAPAVKTGAKLRPAGSSGPKRRPLALLLGIVLALAGAGGVYIGLGQNGEVSALVTKTDLARGDQIHKADLTTISVSKNTKGIITPKQLNDAIGKKATVDLPSGSLVTGSTVADSVEIPESTTVVGIAVPPAGLPSRQLRAGDHVRIVHAPADQGTQGDNKPASITATVEQTRTNRDVGLTIVDVSLSTGQAETATRWSAAGAAAIVVDSDATGSKDEGNGK